MSPRMHGETAKAYGERRQHEAQLLAYQPGAPVELPIACRCPFRPYPHLLSGVDRDKHKTARWLAYKPTNPVGDGTRRSR